MAQLLIEQFNSSSIMMSDLMLSKKWRGHLNAIGGYFVVKKDDENHYYHFYDKNLSDYFLFTNAYLERGKTHCHSYALLYRGEDGKVYFKLNFKI